MFGNFFSSFPTENNVTVNELNDVIKNDQTVTILDVRSPQECYGLLTKIDGAINIPVERLQSEIDKLEDHRDKEIYVVCHSGSRSLMAAKLLLKNGFKVKNVIGGMANYCALYNN